MPAAKHEVTEIAPDDVLIMVRVNTRGGMAGGQVRYCGSEVEMPYGLIQGGFGLDLKVSGEVLEINPIYVSEIFPVRLWIERLEHGNTNYPNPLVHYHVFPDRFKLVTGAPLDHDARKRILDGAYREVTC